MCSQYQEYYKIWHIEQIPYYVDEDGDGYEILDKIVGEWIDQILTSTKAPQRLIDKILWFSKKRPEGTHQEDLKYWLTDRDP